MTVSRFLVDRNGLFLENFQRFKGWMYLTPSKRNVPTLWITVKYGLVCNFIFGGWMPNRNFSAVYLMYCRKCWVIHLLMSPRQLISETFIKVIVITGEVNLGIICIKSEADVVWSYEMSKTGLPTLPIHAGDSRFLALSPSMLQVSISGISNSNSRGANGEFNLHTVKALNPKLSRNQLLLSLLLFV